MHTFYPFHQTQWRHLHGSVHNTIEVDGDLQEGGHRSSRGWGRCRCRRPQLLGHLKPLPGASATAGRSSPPSCVESESGWEMEGDENGRERGWRERKKTSKCPPFRRDLPRRRGCATAAFPHQTERRRRLLLLRERAGRAMSGWESWDERRERGASFPDCARLSQPHYATRPTAEGLVKSWNADRRGGGSCL